MTLRERVDATFEQGSAATRDDARALIEEFRRALSAGEIRSAEPDSSTASGWRVNEWVKRGILLAFRFGDTVDMTVDHGRWPFFDKDTLPLKRLAGAGVRIVPGGSSVRDGAYLGKGVICMRRCTSTSAPTLATNR